MGKLAALVVIAAVGATATSIAAGSSEKASLRLVDRDPLTVHGQWFGRAERVRVTASAPDSASTTAASPVLRRTVRATATGSFRVVFAGTFFDRCSSLRVAAVGGQGSRAVLKVLPSPMCLPSRSS
jgi:hypothetical protein